MSYKVRGQIDGLSEMLASLDGVSKAVRQRAIKKGVTKASRIVAKAAKQGAPREAGLLKKSVGSKVKVYRNGGATVGLVGPRLGFRSSVVRKKGKWRPTPAVSDPVKYAHLVELGTAPHPIGKGSNGRKKVAKGAMHPGFQGKAFLSGALKASAAAVREAIASAVREALQGKGK